MPANQTSFGPSRTIDPSRGWILFVTLALFLLPGTLQRDPWKMEDATHFGVVWRALESGNWTLFHLTSTSLAEPPLYYWLGALTGTLLQPLLSAPAAIRAATAVFIALAAFALFHAARRLVGSRLPGAAPLFLIGALGLLIASHDVQPTTATLASLALLLLGAGYVERPFLAGGLIALGVAGTLLAGGLRLAPILLVSLVAIVLSRKRGAVSAAAIGLTCGSALFAAWWLTLHRQSPDIALQWFSHQMSLLRPDSGAARNLWDEVVTLSWFAWPVWPLALYALWAKRRRLAEDGFRVPLAMVTATLLVLALSSDIRQSWYVILLAPLALMATAGLESIRRGGESLFDWFGRMTFGLFLVVLVLGWTAMTFGWPAKWAAKSERWAPGFVGQFEPVAVAVALACIAGWIWACIRLPRSPQKSLFAWTGGLTAFWVVVVMLWLPWFDYQRSFRGLASGVAAQLPVDACVVARGMGEAQFALFDYYLGPPLHRRTPTGQPCRYELVQGNPAIEIAPEGHWRRIWEGGRPGDRNERYRLYIRP
jgi:4-amino-4-deoxy-L-arabinose transferase-like glycosyltransferase